MTNYIALVYSLAGVILAGFFAFAMGYAYRHRTKVNRNQEEFITAHRQVGMVRIGWSFFAGALGAWVIASPAQYTPYAGWIGLFFYAFSSGLPVLMIAYAGEVIRNKVPHVQSLTDFMGWRYGWVAKTYVVLLCLLNMSIAMLAEYTAVGTLFSDYLGSKAYPITIVVGILTLIYTAYGGLIVSIVTDQVQGVAVSLLFCITTIYMIATFRYPLLGDPFPEGDCSSDINANPMGFCISGKNKTGYSSIFTMPASLFTATVFSEAMWQRAWASQNKRSLTRGSWLGCTGIVLVVFFFGLCGLLAAWAGLITGDTNYNLWLFKAFKGAMSPVDGTVSNWIGVLAILLAVIMNMSAVDSLQNGITAAISSHLLKGQPLAYTRLAVLIINIPLIVLGARPNGINLKILDLFALANMMCCTSAVPVMLGLVERLHSVLGGASMVFSCIFSFAMTSVYGVKYYYRNFDEIRLTKAFGCDCLNLPADLSGLSEADAEFIGGCITSCPTLDYQDKNLAEGMRFTWMGNGYLWDFFLVPICVSLGSMMLCAALNKALQRATAKPAVKGFTSPATHPDMYPAPEPSEGSVEEKSSGEQFMMKQEAGDEAAAAAAATAPVAVA